jgi:hypothetical protein
MIASAESPDPAAGSSQKRVPDFFIVGHAKSGTTALYRMLRQQPQIFMPDVKEPWFFVPEFRLRKGKSSRLPDTLEEYLSLFGAATPEQRAGEATPSYLWSLTAAERIAEVAPDARIIAILREPASFLRSLHLQFMQTDVETVADFGKAIGLEPARREGKEMPRNSARPKALLYSDHVQYVEQLRRYHARFPPQNVLVLIYEDFRAENEATVRRVLEFLGVQEIAPIDVIDANPTVRVRAARTNELVRSLYLGRGPVTRRVKAVIKALTPRRLRRDAIAFERRAQWGEPLPPDQDLMRELRVRFRDEVVALSEYLDRDLVSLWGYNDLD